jgi:hypothetical protein
MQWLTYGEFKEGRGSEIAGVCADSNTFLRYTNDATRRLLRRRGSSSWNGTEVNIRVCLYQSCITWPQQVQLPMAVTLCRTAIPVWGNWYEFLPFNREICRSGAGLFGSMWGGNAHVTQGDYSPVFRQIECGEKYVRWYVQRQADIGKVITLYGIDANGQEIRTTWDDGTFRLGVQLVAALPFVSTSFQLRRVTRVLLPADMEGPSTLFQYDATNDVLIDMAAYQPRERSPMYRTSRLVGRRASEACPAQVEAIVKLAFIPVVTDDDPVLITNEDALMLMIQAIKYEDAGDPDTALKYEAKAIHELNLELADNGPKSQLPVTFMPFGTALPVTHRIGTWT